MRLENLDDYEKQRTYDLLVTKAEKLYGISREVKMKTLEDYWEYPTKAPSATDESALRNCNTVFWHTKVKSITELEACMNYVHDGFLLYDPDSTDAIDRCVIDTLERCVSMYTYWLKRMKVSNFEYISNAMPNLPEWFFEHTESLFATILGDLALLFNICPHSLQKKGLKLEDVQKIDDLFSKVFHTIAMIGDIPKDAVETVTNNALGNDIKNTMSRKLYPWLWSNILKMLLYIVDRWFYTDVDPNNVPKIAEQAIKLLINGFIMASHESFPEVRLWQEYEMLCKGIIHIDTVCKEWKAICETLTVYRLKKMYGQHCGYVARNTYINQNHFRLSSIISMMEDENMLQCWARFIVLLGNPADLMAANSVVRSCRRDWKKVKHKVQPEKREFAVEKARAIYPRVCLLMIKGLRSMINTMLSVGLPNPNNNEYDNARPESPDKLAASQANYRRPLYESYATPSQSAPSKLDYRQKDAPLDSKLIPTGNSVLRLFGEWLFDCTQYIGKISHRDEFYKANAEALGTLCYIFSHNRYDDPFEEIYMVRFVIRLTQGLKCGKRQLEKDKGVHDKTNDILVKILQQSGSLFKVDLPGINALLSSYIKMIDQVLGFHEDSYASRELRRDAIEILLSIICLPLRYPTTPLQDLEGDSKLAGSYQNMGDLWFKCMEILIRALENSIDEDSLINKSQIMKGLYILLLDKRYDPNTTVEDYSSSNQPSPTSKYRDFADNPLDANPKTGSHSSITEQLGDEDPLYNLWIRMIDLICKILERTSSQDIKFWYVPFGILCGLANTFPYSSRLKVGYQTIIKKMCDYIESLSSRPVTQHREELHTMLAAAYNTLTVWCLNYTELFGDDTSLFSCMQVIELGISSKCSYNHKTKEKFLKEDKKNKAISQRVGDKAQFLLKQLNNHHPLTDHQTQHHLSERLLLEYWQNQYPGQHARLQYLVVESYTILCLINPPPGAHASQGDNQNTPVLYLVLRDPDISLSVHWFRYEKDPLTDTSAPRKKVPRPDVTEDPATEPVEREPQKLSWPPILSQKYDLKEDTRTFADLQKTLRADNCDQKEFITEKKLYEVIEEHKRKSASLPTPPPAVDLQIPDCVEDMDSARLFLSHAGVLTPKMLDDSESLPSVILLKDSPGLDKRLRELDSIPTRDCHTVVVLYMRSGQNKIQEIFRNSNTLHNKTFHDFVVELGNKIVDVSKFKGWTGLQPFATWSNSNINTAPPTFPYYSDSFNEMIFIIPNLVPCQEHDEVDHDSPRSSPDSGNALFDAEFDQAKVEFKPRKGYYQRDLLENILWEAPTDTNFGKERTLLSKIVVVWAESFDDTLRFPIKNLTHGLGCEKDARCVVIFVHPLRSGLFKTSVLSLNSADKFNTVGLLDEKEKVVSKHILPIVVRETCLAIRTSSLLEQPPKLRPKSRRQNHIDTIVKEHSSKDYANGYFNCFCKEH